MSEGTGRFVLVLNCPSYGKNEAKPSDQIPGLPPEAGADRKQQLWSCGRAEVNNYSGQSSSLADSCSFSYPNHRHISPVTHGSNPHS